jgi:hypothetical protein
MRQRYLCQPTRLVSVMCCAILRSAACAAQCSAVQVIVLETAIGMVEISCGPIFILFPEALYADTSCLARKE